MESNKTFEKGMENQKEDERNGYCVRSATYTYTYLCFLFIVYVAFIVSQRRKSTADEQY